MAGIKDCCNVLKDKFVESLKSGEFFALALEFGVAAAITYIFDQVTAVTGVDSRTLDLVKYGMTAMLARVVGKTALDMQELGYIEDKKYAAAQIGMGPTTCSERTARGVQVAAIIAGVTAIVAQWASPTALAANIARKIGLPVSTALGALGRLALFAAKESKFNGANGYTTPLPLTAPTVTQPLLAQPAAATPQYGSV